MTRPDLTRPPHGDHRHARRRLLAALVAVVTAVLAAGCGLRLETDPPAPLVPDEVEQVRQRTTADAVALEVLAGQAATTDPTVLALLGQVQAAGRAHLAALGGSYRPNDESETAGPTGTTGTTGTDAAAEPTGSASPAASPATGDPATGDAVSGADVLALLTESAASARADAAAVPDGPLARVLAAVAVARLLLADVLGAALGPAAELPAPQPFEVPAELPAGVSDQAVVVLVQSEDAVGLTWEVVAARRQDPDRALAAERAAEHRQRAEDWARAAGISGTGSDPRRSTYALPHEVTDAAADPAATTAALAALEGALAADYASLVAVTASGARTPLIDAMLDAGRTQASLTGVVPLFPGLPEQTDPAPPQG